LTPQVVIFVDIICVGCWCGARCGTKFEKSPHAPLLETLQQNSIGNGKETLRRKKRNTVKEGGSEES